MLCIPFLETYHVVEQFHQSYSRLCSLRLVASVGHFIHNRGYEPNFGFADSKCDQVITVSLSQSSVKSNLEHNANILGLLKFFRVLQLVNSLSILL